MNCSSSVLCPEYYDFIQLGGPLDHYAGTLVLSAAGFDGGVSGLSSAISIYPGTGFKFDNTASALGNRLDPNGIHNVNLYGGDFSITGLTTGGTSPVDTTNVGQVLNLFSTSSITMTGGSGGAILDLSQSNGNGDSVQRQSNATVLFRGPGLGGAPAAANISNIKLPGTLTNVVTNGSGTAGSPGVGILPWAIGDATTTGSGTDFVTS